MDTLYHSTNIPLISTIKSVMAKGKTTPGWGVWLTSNHLWDEGTVAPWRPNWCFPLPETKEFTTEGLLPQKERLIWTNHQVSGPNCLLVSGKWAKLSCGFRVIGARAPTISKTKGSCNHTNLGVFFLSRFGVNYSDTKKARWCFETECREWITRKCMTFPKHDPWLNSTPMSFRFEYMQRLHPIGTMSSTSRNAICLVRDLSTFTMS